jgi:hypothetical protein
MSAILFELESVNFVGDWNYVSTNDICDICKTSLYKPSDLKKEKTYNNNCSISMGECKHAFHRKCIKHFTRYENNCPFYDKGFNNEPPCKNIFKFEKELETKGTIKIFKH